MWSSASPRCWAAATAISRRSLTFAWPVKSEKSDGRSVSSSATSGLFSVEIGRSAIGQNHAKTGGERQDKSRVRLTSYPCRNWPRLAKILQTTRTDESVYCSADFQSISISQIEADPETFGVHALACSYWAHLEAWPPNRSHPLFTASGCL